MYSRDPFNLRKAPVSPSQTALSFLQHAASRTLETGSAAVESSRQLIVDSAEDMAFNVPRNVPNFENAQRRFEDNVWGKFTGNEKGLPMYKDKPAGYGPKRRDVRKSSVGIVVLVLVGVLYWLGWFGKGGEESVGPGGKKGGWSSIIPSSSSKGKVVDWEQRREAVREAFKQSWKGYEDHGWGWSYRARSMQILGR
jgi:mannosyl-oligosaccharide alpha-1,2-mannosidase